MVVKLQKYIVFKDGVIIFINDMIRVMLLNSLEYNFWYWEIENIVIFLKVMLDNFVDMDFVNILVKVVFKDLDV